MKLIIATASLLFIAHQSQAATPTLKALECMTATGVSLASTKITTKSDTLVVNAQWGTFKKVFIASVAKIEKSAAIIDLSNEAGEKEYALSLNLVSEKENTHEMAGSLNHYSQYVEGKMIPVAAAYCKVQFLE